MTDYSNISDIFNDANGFRPRADWMKRFNESTPEEKAAEAATLEKYVVESIGRQKRAAAANLRDWTIRIKEMMVDFDINRQTAIRWDMTAFNVNGDIGFYLYQNGLPYSMESEIFAITDL